MTVGSATTLVIDRVVTPVAKMHSHISRRWFKGVGRLGKPVALAHDTIAATVYNSVRLAGSVAGIGIDLAVTNRPRLTTGTQAVVNGIWGDRLGRHQQQLEIPMGLRDSSGTAIPIERVNTAFPDASGHLVVLVHGFAGTERCWQTKGAAPGLFDSIAEAPRLTPVMIRYNTGRGVRENGEVLAQMLDRLHAEWPVPVDSIALVGHSMGGLVIGHACTVARTCGQPWVMDTTELITLGSPHQGTPIEKLVARLAHGLGHSGGTDPLREFLDTRSRGIKDLRSGVPANRLPGINQRLIAGVLTKDPSHPAGGLVGDLVVGVASASGGPDADPANVVVIGGVRHNGLVRNNEAVRQILDWIQPHE